MFDSLKICPLKLRDEFPYCVKRVAVAVMGIEGSDDENRYSSADISSDPKERVGDGV
jgi:hypothetical protein